ncbi:hypothetical protein SNEBB_003980 [Seison nebaliae]|nr:hypothetical protein SNEBB_003980 [Seison nebaliae]
MPKKGGKKKGKKGKRAGPRKKAKGKGKGKGRGRKGKGKKSKRQRELEAERLRQQEEEARLAALAEESRLQEQREREAQEKKRRDKETLELKIKELGEFYELFGNRKELTLNLMEKITSEMEWRYYVECVNRVNPYNAAIMNSFITLWSESIMTDTEDFDEEHTRTALNVIFALQYIIQHIKPSKSLKDEMESFIVKLYQLCNDKICDHILRKMCRAQVNADSETLNFQYTNNLVNFFSICTWANLSMNPRQKQHEFETSDGYGFELCRALTMSMIIVAFQHYPFDYLSGRSLSSFTNEKFPPLKYEDLPEPEKETEKDPSETASQIEVEIDFGKKKNTDFESRRQSISEVTKSEMSFRGSINRSRMSKQLIEIYPYDIPTHLENIEKKRLKLLCDRHVIDLRMFRTIHGFTQIELYDVPPQEKKVADVILSQVPEKRRLNRLHFPQEEKVRRMNEDHLVEQLPNGQRINRNEERVSSSMATGENAKARPFSRKLDERHLTPEDEPYLQMMMTEEQRRGMLEEDIVAELREFKRHVNDERPITMYITLPNFVFCKEHPIVGRWDESEEAWRTDRIYDVDYNEKKRIIQFTSYEMGPYSLLIDRYAFFPFQSWYLYPIDVNHCLFHLITLEFELMIEIKFVPKLGCQSGNFR